VRAGENENVAHLEEQRIAGLLLNSGLHAGGVSHQQVIAHHLQQSHQPSVMPVTHHYIAAASNSSSKMQCCTRPPARHSVGSCDLWAAA
jgi:hypothetical protein